MPELEDILEQNAIPLMRRIHDCVDTGGSLSLSGGVEVLFPIDCALRDYNSAGALWDKVTSIITDSIDNNEIKVKLRLVLNGPINSTCVIKVVVPHPTFGDIEVDNQEIVLYRNNTDVAFTAFTLLYNGIDSEATTYGFKVTLIPTSSMTLKSRSILITA